MLSLIAPWIRVSAGSCKDDVAGYRRDPDLRSAVATYFAVHAIHARAPTNPRIHPPAGCVCLQNITVFGGPGGLMEPCQLCDYELEQVCEGMGGDYCQGGGSVAVHWTSNATHHKHTLTGTVVRPPSRLCVCVWPPGACSCVCTCTEHVLPLRMLRRPGPDV